MEILSFTEAAEKLAEYGIKRHEIYLIDLVILCEMAWADGQLQDGEREILLSYLNLHVDSINRLAGCRVLAYKDARDFLNRFLDSCPNIELLDTIREVIPAIRLNEKDPREADETCVTILDACLDVAASSVTHYPYGLTERFTDEEKELYHKLTTVLKKSSVN